MEGEVSGSAHYDNVAPALLGGLQLMLPGRLSEALPIFDEWILVIHHPGIEISTRMARDILPKSLKLSEAICYWQRLSGFIHSIYRGDRELASSILQDNLIEPYRSSLIPKFALGKKAALEAGALAFSISGSGPACVAIVDSMDKAKLVHAAVNGAMHYSDAPP